MAQLGCRCGERMYTSDDPCPYIVDIYYKAEADKAIGDDSEITLHNFMLGWDEKNNCQREYMERPEPVEYWFCPVCKRVYEVQCFPGGRWLRIYKKSDSMKSEGHDGWKQIYVITDTDVYVAYEKSEDIRLSDYLQQHDTILYYLSPDEKIAHAVDKTTAKVLFSYELEDSWSPSAED